MIRTTADGNDPTANGVGRPGYKETGPNATTLGGAEMNHIQEEIARSIELLGGTLSSGSKEQLGTILATHVAGPSSATDEAFARFDSTTGKRVQDGVVKATDAGAVTGVTSLVMGGALSGVTTLSLSGATTGGTTINTSGTITAGDDLVATDDVIAGDGFFYSSAKTRVVLLPAEDLTPAGNPSGDDWVFTFSSGTGSYWASRVAVARLSINLNSHLPSVSQITQIRVLVTPAAARSPGSRVFFRAHRCGASGTTISAAFTTSDYQDDGTTSKQWVSSGAITFNGASSTFRQLEIAAGTPTTGDQIHAVEITYSDIGPINPS